MPNQSAGPLAINTKAWLSVQSAPTDVAIEVVLSLIAGTRIRLAPTFASWSTMSVASTSTQISTHNDHLSLTKILTSEAG